MVLIDEFLDHTCNVYKVVVDKSNIDNLGKPATTKRTVISNLACRVDPTRIRSREVIPEGPEAAGYTYNAMIYTAWTSTKITEDMRIEVITSDAYSGNYYEIISVDPIYDLAGDGHHLEITVRQGRNV